RGVRLRRLRYPAPMASSPPSGPHPPASDQRAWVEKGKRLLKSGSMNRIPASGADAEGAKPRLQRSASDGKLANPRSAEAERVYAEVQALLQNRAAYDVLLKDFFTPIEQANSELEQARKTGVYTQELFDKARAALKALNDENERQKTRFDTEWQETEREYKKIANGDYGDPIGVHFQDALGSFARTGPNLERLVSN